MPDIGARKTRLAIGIWPIVSGLRYDEDNGTEPGRFAFMVPNHSVDLQS
jgi:hypothetical protein